MKNRNYCFIDAMAHIMLVALLLLITLITVGSIRKNEYFQLNDVNEIPRYWYGHSMEWIFLLLLLIFTFIICSYKGFFIRKYHALMRLSFIWAVIISVCLVFVLRAIPYADAATCSNLAISFNKGDFSDFTPGAGGYITIYPFQVGYIAILQLVYLIVGSESYIAAQLVNVPMILLIIDMFYHIIDISVENENKKKNILGISAVLFMIMLPLYFLVIYAYGDMIAWAMALTAVYTFQRYMKNGRIRDIIFTGIFIGIAIQVKSNEWIFLIAIEMTFVAHILARHEWKLTGWIIYLIIPAIIMSGVLKYSYMKAANLTEFPKGAPKTSWIAMGMQEIDDSPMAFGWYNGYNHNLYVECGYDYEKANELAKNDIKCSLIKYSHEPIHAAYLFYQKISSMWLEPAYGTQLKLEWQTRHNDDLPLFAQWVISGRGRDIIYQVLSVIHFVILIFTLLSCIVNYRKMNSFWLLPLLIIFGGIMFHMMWEAHCRYMFIYYLIMLPYAASGVDWISRDFVGKLVMKGKIGYGTSQARR